MSAGCKIAFDVKIFQHLKDAGPAGLSPNVLAEKTGVDVLLLSRLMRHMAAMFLVAFSDGSFHGTALSNGLSAENFQHSIAFCYNDARPSFNNFPDYFKKTSYMNPNPGTHGPFQDAHKIDTPFFEWLVATPPHLQVCV